MPGSEVANDAEAFLTAKAPPWGLKKPRAGRGRTF